MKKIIFFSLIIFFSNLNTLLALDKKKLPNEEWSSKIESLDWKNFDNKEHSAPIKYGANAKVLILENEYYLDDHKNIDQYHWWSFGHETDKTMVMLIKADGYQIFLDYINDGYIKLDDWKNVNTKDLLKQMKDRAKSNENYFKERKLDYATDVNWIFKPTLNEENKSVSYSYKVKWNDGTETMESKNLILGKKGHLESIFVVHVKDSSMDFKSNAEFSKDFANGVVFNDGFKHSDYKEGDKLAVAGIGGLVAGSLGVKALAKTGLLVKLAKFWWILLAPLAFLGKFLSGKDSTSGSSESNPTRPRRRRKK